MYLLLLQYLDPRYRYILRPSTSSSSGEYLVSVGPPSRSRSDYQQFMVRASSTENTNSSPNQQNTQQQQQQQTNPNSHQHYHPHHHQSHEQVAGTITAATTAPTTRNQHDQQKSGKHCHGHSCTPCMGHFVNKEKNGDNTSLDAYDLASPCCDPHCVPTRLILIITFTHR